MTEARFGPTGKVLNLDELSPEERKEAKRRSFEINRGRLKNPVYAKQIQVARIDRKYEPLTDSVTRMLNRIQFGHHRKSSTKNAILRDLEKIAYRVIENDELDPEKKLRFYKTLFGMASDRVLKISVQDQQKKTFLENGGNNIQVNNYYDKDCVENTSEIIDMNGLRDKVGK